MIPDFLMYPKDLKSLLLGLPKPPEIELLQQKDPSIPSINWLKLPQLEREFFYWEAQEIEKLSVISAFALVKRVHTQLLVLGLRVENSKEQEEEDEDEDDKFNSIINKYINHLPYSQVELWREKECWILKGCRKYLGILLARIIHLILYANAIVIFNSEHIRYFS